MTFTRSNRIETSWRRRRAGHRQAVHCLAAVGVEGAGEQFRAALARRTAFATAVGSFLSEPTMPA